MKNRPEGRKLRASYTAKPRIIVLRPSMAFIKLIFDERYLIPDFLDKRWVETSIWHATLYSSSCQVIARGSGHSEKDAIAGIRSEVRQLRIDKAEQVSKRIFEEKTDYSLKFQGISFDKKVQAAEEFQRLEDEAKERFKEFCKWEKSEKF